MKIARFCPSPTGFLHIGNARTLLINYLYSKSVGGKFFVRVDDTDLKRSKSEYTDAIIKDIDWLGVKYDFLFKQSDRLGIYEKIKQDLLDKGRLYPCFETEEELQLKRKIQLSRKVPPIYDRAALKLSQSEIDKKIASGKTPHYRFKLNDEEIKWNDKIRGNISFKARSFSDPIVIRDDKSPTYTFCSVIDDIEYEVTDIIRGEDHITNTAIQIQIFNELTDKLPDFAHLSLLKTKDGEISKRFGGNEVRSYFKNGIDSMSLNSYLAKIGSSRNVKPNISMQKLIDEFDFKNFSQSAVIFADEDLLRLNHKVIAEYDYEVIKTKAKEFNIEEISKEFYNIIKDNLETIFDVEKWSQAIDNPAKVDFDIDDKKFLKQILDFLPSNFDENFYDNWLNDIKTNTDRKGRKLFDPIRLAITGYSSGPELKKIIPYIGLKELVNRIESNGA